MVRQFLIGCCALFALPYAVPLAVAPAGEPTKCESAKCESVAADATAEGHPPGTPCTVRAELRGTSGDMILIAVPSRHDQGVPLLSKVPYVQRLFTNTGTAERMVVIAIPREHIASIGPVGGETCSKPAKAACAQECRPWEAPATGLRRTSDLPREELPCPIAETEYSDPFHIVHDFSLAPVMRACGAVCGFTAKCDTAACCAESCGKSCGKQDSGSCGENTKGVCRPAKTATITVTAKKGTVTAKKGTVTAKKGCDACGCGDKCGCSTQAKCSPDCKCDDSNGANLTCSTLTLFLNGNPCPWTGAQAKPDAQVAASDAPGAHGQTMPPKAPSPYAPPGSPTALAWPASVPHPVPTPPAFVMANPGPPQYAPPMPPMPPMHPGMMEQLMTLRAENAKLQAQAEAREELAKQRELFLEELVQAKLENAQLAAQLELVDQREDLVEQLVETMIDKARLEGHVHSVEERAALAVELARTQTAETPGDARAAGLMRELARFHDENHRLSARLAELQRQLERESARTAERQSVPDLEAELNSPR